MAKKYFAARMKEYNKAKGHLRRNTLVMGRSWSAGNETKGLPFVPSPIVIISREEAAELLRKDQAGRPVYRQPGSQNTPVFDVFTAENKKAFLGVAQRESDQRASMGLSAARALVGGQIAQVLADEPTPELEPDLPVNLDEDELKEPDEMIRSMDDAPMNGNSLDESDPLTGDLTTVEGAEDDDDIEEGPTSPAESVSPKTETPKVETKPSSSPKGGSKAKPKGGSKAKPKGGSKAKPKGTGRPGTAS